MKYPQSQSLDNQRESVDTSSLESLLQNHSQNSNFYPKKNREKGEALFGSLFGVIGFIYSFVSPAIHGYRVASGSSTLHPLVFLPGPLFGSLGGNMMGNPGGLRVASYCAVTEVVSFAAGYGLGYLTR